MTSEDTRLNGPVIDAHVHIFSPDVIEARDEYLERDEWFRNLYQDPGPPMVPYEDVIREMDETRVDHSVIFGFAYKDQGLCRETNDYVLEAVRAHPDRFTGMACVSPEEPGAVAELERCLDAGLRGCGELFPDGQGMDLRDSPGLDRVAGVLEERGMLISIHSNEPVGHDYPGKGHNGPEPCYEFALRHPELHIIYSHLGGGLFLYEMMPQVRESIPRVYYDTATAPFLYRRDIYSLAATAAGPEKLLFGSDYPLISPQRYLNETEDLEGVFREALFGYNAASLLGSEVKASVR